MLECWRDGGKSNCEVSSESYMLMNAFSITPLLQYSKLQYSCGLSPESPLGAESSRVLRIRILYSCQPVLIFTGLAPGLPVELTP